MQNMNKGSRTKDCPLGDETVTREVTGNEIMRRALYLCKLLHEHGSFFTLENPLTSYAWQTPKMLELMRDSLCRQVVFDQCQYGLKIPSVDNSLGLALKPTTMLGILPFLERLEKRCGHTHTCGRFGRCQAQGQVAKTISACRRISNAPVQRHRISL